MIFPFGLPRIREWHLHWKKCKDTYLSTDEGGLGFRRLQDVIDTLSLRLGGYSLLKDRYGLIFY